MGLNPPAVSFLLASRAKGVSFERMITLGRQRMYAAPATLRRAYAEQRLELSSEDATRLLGDADGFADPLLRALGASTLDALDASPYEGCSIVHDLNAPLPRHLVGAYSAVLDSGTLEHVFDVRTALRNVMELARVGGHVMVISPTNGESGHGFYQFSPEFFFRAFSAENGFALECVLARGQADRAGWYELTDPDRVGRRVTLRGPGSTYLYARARRVADVPILATPPQQSDYMSAWQDIAPPDAPATRRTAAVADRLRARVEGVVDRVATRREPRGFRAIDRP